MKCAYREEVDERTLWMKAMRSIAENAAQREADSHRL